MTKRWVGITIFLTGLAVVFQNCSSYKFEEKSEGSAASASTQSTDNTLPNTPPPEDARLHSAVIHTKFGESVEFTMVLEATNPSEWKLSLAKDSDLDRQDNGSGLLEIVDATKRLLRYTPNAGLRGQDQFNVYASNGKSEPLFANATIKVESLFTQIKPVMAVRATGCTMCHANVQSSVITDFGYKGDGITDYFMGGDISLSALGGSVYGNWGTNWSTATVNGVISIPKATIAKGVVDNTEEVKLVDYLRSELEKNTQQETPEILEFDEIYIGAPTKAKLLANSGLDKSGELYKYIKDNSGSANLNGLVHMSANGYFTNDPSKVFTCSGDLVINGTLFLNDLRLFTDRAGCRIYATESVFIQGKIEYVGGEAGRNLQISSARSINLGMGKIDNCRGPNYEYGYDRFVVNSFVGFDSLSYRIKEIWTRTGYYTRETGKTVQQKLDDIYNDSQKIPGLADAACGPSRDISFERLLLNAPHINSRYMGDFNGVVISEIALFSLGSFKFSFDPVFADANILPLLPQSDYLMMK